MPQPMNAARHVSAHRSRTLAALVLALLAGIVVLSVGEPAYAHAKFPDIEAPLPPSTEQRLNLDVPLEPFEFEEQVPDPLTFYNEKVETLIPPGWEVLSCGEVAGWDCSLTSSQITWTKKPGPENENREIFTFTAKTPGKPGTYFFKTLQTYSSGCGGHCIGSWNNESGEENPSPRLVVAGATGSPSAAPAGAGAPSPTPASDSGAEQSDAGGTSTLVTVIVVMALLLAVVALVRRLRRH